MERLDFTEKGGRIQVRERLGASQSPLLFNLKRGDQRRIPEGGRKSQQPSLTENCRRKKRNLLATCKRKESGILHLLEGKNRLS